MRRLAVLIKRELVDHSDLFVGACVAAIILVCLSLFLVSAYNRRDVPPPHTMALFLPLPLLLALGFCGAGVIQSHRNRAHGISALLSVLPVGRRQMALASILTGIVVVLLVFVPVILVLIAIEIVSGPAEPSSRRMLVEVFAGVSLCSFACYCIGALVGRHAQTQTIVLGAFPLAATLSLLVVAKGFEWPLLAILGFFVGACAVVLANPAAKGAGVKAAVALIVLVLLAGLLFWARFTCGLLLAGAAPGDASRVEISPSGLVPLEVEDDPNVTRHSIAAGEIRGETSRRWTARRVLSCLALPCLHLRSLGIVDYFEGERGSRVAIDYYEYLNYGDLYFDGAIGQLVYAQERRPSERDCYAGPNGVSNTYDPNLGRFSHPVVGFGVLYEDDRQCFFAFNFRDRVVRKGPRLTDAERHPVCIGRPLLYSAIEHSVWWSPPTERSSYDMGHGYVPRDRAIGPYRESEKYDDMYPYLAVLDASGRVDLLHRQTLELVGTAGYLPEPRTLFGKALRQPRHLLAYEITLIQGPEREHAGMVAGCLPPEGSPLTIGVFGRDGAMIAESHSKTLSEIPWQPAVAVLQYLVESLHPPVLTLASFLTAYSFDAGATRRALFLMPNSFVAQQRDRQTSFFVQLLWALVFMMPGILFAGYLSWRVRADARAIGVSAWGRRIWTAGTVLFGLPAYVTYRLMRPKCVLTPCRECGRGRRVDRETCHHCGRGWRPPKMEPPSWRVIDRTPRV